MALTEEEKRALAAEYIAQISGRSPRTDLIPASTQKPATTQKPAASADVLSSQNSGNNKEETNKNPTSSEGKKPQNSNSTADETTTKNKKSQKGVMPNQKGNNPFWNAFAKKEETEEDDAEEKPDINQLIPPAQRARIEMSNNIAKAAGVKQETIDKIAEEAAVKFDKDIFSESVDSGVANIAANTVGGLDFVLGNVLGWENNPLAGVNTKLQEWKAEESAEAMEAVNRTGKGKPAEFASQAITVGTQMVPDIALSFLTGGASAAASGAKYGLKALTSAKTFLPAVKQMAVSTIKNPSFWLNFEQMLYPEYESAVMNGADEKEATITALLSSFAQAKIESGTGYQKLPNANAQTVKRAIFDFVKSAIEEGNEEVLQGITSGITQKIVFDHNKDWVTNNPEEDAVLNLANAFEEWVMGTFMGGVASIPGGMVNAGNAITAQKGNLFVDSSEPPIAPQNPVQNPVENITPPEQNPQEAGFASGTNQQKPLSEVEQLIAKVEQLQKSIDGIVTPETNPVAQPTGEAAKLIGKVDDIANKWGVKPVLEQTVQETPQAKNELIDQLIPQQATSNVENPVQQTAESRTVENKMAQPDSGTQNPITNQDVAEAAEMLNENPQTVLQEPVPEKTLTEEAKRNIESALDKKLYEGAKKNLDAIAREGLSVDNVTFKGQVPGFNDLQRAVIVKQLIAQKGKDVIDIDVPNDGTMEINNHPMAIATLLDQLKVSLDLHKGSNISRAAGTVFNDKSHPITHMTSNGRHYLTNGVVVVETNEDGVAKMKDTKPTQFRESNSDLLSRFENVQWQKITTQPTSVTVDKNKYYVFKSESDSFVFDKKYVDAIDGGEMYIGSIPYTSGKKDPFIKTLGVEGEIAGLVLGYNTHSEQASKIIRLAEDSTGVVNSTNEIPQAAKLRSISGRKTTGSGKKDVDSSLWDRADKYIGAQSRAQASETRAQNNNVDVELHNMSVLGETSDAQTNYGGNNVEHQTAEQVTNQELTQNDIARYETRLELFKKYKEEGYNSLSREEKNRIDKMIEYDILDPMNVDEAIAKTERLLGRNESNVDSPITSNKEEPNAEAEKDEVAFPRLNNMKEEIFKGKKYTLEEINELPEIQEAKKRANLDSKETSTVKFTDEKTGEWLPERKETQNKIISELMNLGSAVIDAKGKVEYNGIVEQGRHADIVIGPPAAGKSTVFADPLSQQHKARIIDSDMVKERLPEFDSGYGANFVHEESASIAANELTDNAIAKGENVVFPLVGGNTKKIRNLINQLRNDGYTVNLYYNEVPAEVAMNRAFARFIKNGRFLPLDYVAGIYSNPEKNPTVTYYTLLKEGAADYYEHKSNDVPFGTKPPFVEDPTGRDLYRPGNQGGVRYEQPIRQSGHSDSDNERNETQKQSNGKQQITDEKADVDNSNTGSFNGKNSKEDEHQNTVGAMQSNPNSYSYAQNNYGTYPEGEKPTRIVDVPVSTDGKTKVNRFERTEQEAGVTPDKLIKHFEKATEKGLFNYNVKTDNESVEKAKKKIIDKGFEKSIGEFAGLIEGNHKIGKDELVFGEMLYAQAAQTGDTKTAMELASALAQEFTKAGQAVQAARVLKTLSPEGRLYNATQIVNRLNNSKHKAKGQGEITLNDEKGQKLATELLGARTQEEIEAVEEKIKQHIADQVLATKLDKWNAWRYLSMLGNPKTHIRNILGNAAFVPARVIKNGIKSIIESGVKKSNQKYVRTTTFAKPTDAQKKAAEESYERNKKLLFFGGSYRFESDIQNKQKIFENKILETLRVKNSEALEKEDTWFLKPAYMDSFAKYLRANNLDPEHITESQLARAEDYAQKEAWKATYRDVSEVARALENFSQTNAVTKFAMDAILPFRKTPINILARGVEYSPVGLLKSLVFDTRKVKKGEMEAQEMIDHIASGLTGTGVAILGAALAHFGLLSGGDDEDEKVQNFGELQGEQNYALQIGDVSYTIDWLTPISLPLFVGVEAYNVSKGENFDVGNVFSATMDAITKTADPMIGLSMLKNIETILSGNYGGEGSGIGNVIKEAAMSYVLQAFPTLGSQIAQTIDSNRRNAYYTDKTNSIPDELDIPLNRILAKIPLASKLLPEKVDKWGRPVMQEDKIYLRIFENFISPGYISQKNTTKVDEMLSQLYSETGDSGILPGGMSNYFTVNGKRIDLSAKDFVKAQKEKGQVAYGMLEQLVANKRFRNLPAEEKIDIISDVYAYATAMAKEEVSDYKSTTAWYDKMDEAKKAGISNSDYIIQRNYYNNLEEKDGKSKNALMVEQLIADKSNSSKQDVAILEHVVGVDMSKYKSATSDYEMMLKTYGAYQNEGGKAEDISYLSEQLSGDDIKAFALYSTSTANKEYENGKLKNFGAKQLPKAEKLIKAGWKGEDVAKAARAVTGLADYLGKQRKTKKNYVRVLMEIGFSEQQASQFYNIYGW